MSNNGDDEGSSVAPLEETLHQEEQLTAGQRAAMLGIPVPMEEGVQQMLMT